MTNEKGDQLEKPIFKAFPPSPPLILLHSSIVNRHSSVGSTSSHRTLGCQVKRFGDDLFHSLAVAFHRPVVLLEKLEDAPPDARTVFAPQQSLYQALAYLFVRVPGQVLGGGNKDVVVFVFEKFEHRGADLRECIVR